MTALNKLPYNPGPSPWRSPRLLAGLKGLSVQGDLPCFWPLPHTCDCQPGAVVYLHSMQLRAGRGKGIKTHDYRIAFGCPAAHKQCDESSTLEKLEKFAAWETAHRASMGWMIENAVLVVA